MTRLNAAIKNHKSLDDLKQIADTIANHVTMINSITREPTVFETTPQEHDIIAGIVLGALLHIDRCFEWSIGQTVIHTTIQAAESQFIAALFYNMKAFGLSGDSPLYVDAYATVTEPLRNAVRAWANEA